MSVCRALVSHQAKAVGFDVMPTAQYLSSRKPLLVKGPEIHRVAVRQIPPHLAFGVLSGVPIPYQTAPASVSGS